MPPRPNPPFLPPTPAGPRTTTAQYPPVGIPAAKPARTEIPRAAGRPIEPQRRGWMKWEASLIGSAEGVSLRLNSAMVEPLHAAVLRTGEDVYEIWDLNSRSGTFLNGVGVIRARLHDGDQIRIGPFCLRFVGGGTPSGKTTLPKAHRPTQHLPVQAMPVTPPPRPAATPLRSAGRAVPAPIKPQPAYHPYSVRATAASLRGLPKHDPGSGLADNLAPLHKPFPLPGTKTARGSGGSSIPVDVDGEAVQAEMAMLRRQVSAQRRLLEEAARRLREQDVKMTSQSTQFSKMEKQLAELGRTNWTPALRTGSGEIMATSVGVFSNPTPNRPVVPQPRPMGIPVVPASSAHRDEK